MRPKLSILICSIPERAKKLAALIDSLNKQSKEIEIVSIIDSKLIPIGEKRNTLVSLSHGEYITFIDDDDYVTQEYVSSIMEKLCDNPDVVLFDMVRMVNSTVDKVVKLSEKYDRDYDTVEAYHRLPNHLMVYKREIFEAVKFPETSFREDAYWASEVKSRLKKVARVDKVLYHYLYSTSESESNRNYLFTIVIPTIWSSDKIYESVKKLNESYAVGEIIIINNKPEACKRKLEGEKIIEIVPGDNIFVNPAWNLGVKNASYSKICLLNDDVILEDMALHYMTLKLEEKNVGVVGLAKSCYNLSDAHIDYRQRPFYLEQISIRNRGYGCAIFIKKENWVEIPSDLKIWFGDDYLIKKHEGKVFRLHGPKVWADMSQSVESPEVQQIIQSDIQASLRYQLPWSNDYD